MNNAYRKPVLAGIVTGQLAGLIMAVVVMLVFTVFLDKNPLYPVQVIGSMLWGERALEGSNVLAVLTGLVLHQGGPALLWGLLFGLYSRKNPAMSRHEALLAGLVLGVISMAGPYALIPLLMNALHGVDIWNREVPMFWDWAAHLVFGLSFGIYPAVSVRISGRAA
jgi:hypothetical protein